MSATWNSLIIPLQRGAHIHYDECKPTFWSVINSCDDASVSVTGRFNDGSYVGLTIDKKGVVFLKKKFHKQKVRRTLERGFSNYLHTRKIRASSWFYTSRVLIFVNFKMSKTDYYENLKDNSFSVSVIKNASNTNTVNKGFVKTTLLVLSTYLQTDFFFGAWPTKPLYEKQCWPFPLIVDYKT